MTGVMMRLKALVAVTASAAMMTLAAPAIGQELAPEQLALAREYVDLTDRASIFEVTMVEIGIGTMRQIIQQNPDMTEQVDAAVGAALEEFRSRKSELLDQFARVYAARFTAVELQEIVTFYSSPTGEKLAQVNTEVSTELQAVMEVFTNNIRPEFFAKVRSDLRAQGLEL